VRARLGTMVGAALLASALASCGGDDGSGDSGPGSGTLVVFAASSLTNPFGELETAFENDHDGVDVQMSFDSSTTVAEQITESAAPADVLATADQKSMQILVSAGKNAEDPVSFSSNTMAVVTPPDNPAGVKNLADLADTDFVLCDPSVPCGAVADEILANAGINAKPVSLEDKVTSVLSKVELGEADAGMVYVSDAQGAGDKVQTIDIPDDVNVVTPYFISAVKDSDNAELAQEWIDLVISQAGLGVLEDAGFGPPVS
jgi:molybdate transport system substrate-binding protein